MNYDLSHWPQIDRRRVRASFAEVPVEAYPELSGYSRPGIHEGLMGQGGLFLASDMAKLLTLKSGMTVLDLGCGSGTTSLFLATHFGVRVYAVDDGSAVPLAKRAFESGLAGKVIPIQANCRKLPFATGLFDAIFAMNSFFYFGTDDLYPSYLLGFLKAQGEIVIGSPCYREEPGEDVPEEFLIEFPACLAVHSPAWWRSHFTKTKQAAVTHSELHPRGIDFWDDRIRFLLEDQEPAEMEPGRRNMIHAMICLRNRDTDGFVSHFMLHARKF